MYRDPNPRRALTYTPNPTLNSFSVTLNSFRGRGCKRHCKVAPPLLPRVAHTRAATSVRVSRETRPCVRSLLQQDHSYFNKLDVTISNVHAKEEDVQVPPSLPMRSTKAARMRQRGRCSAESSSGASSAAGGRREKRRPSEAASPVANHSGLPPLTCKNSRYNEQDGETGATQEGLGDGK